MIALTFDDGPDPAWTPLVLDALDSAGAAGTFFVVAEQIAEAGGAELLAETLARGHSVQMHCTRHRRHEELDRAELEADADELEAVLAAHGVPEPVLWRPPYGSVHPEHSCPVAAARGRQLIRWSYDTVDYRGLTASRMLRDARSANGLRDDSIVLMHDSRRYTSTPEGGARGTVELIEPLVEHARGLGFELGALQGALGEHDLTARDERERLNLLPCRR